MQVCKTTPPSYYDRLFMFVVVLVSCTAAEIALDVLMMELEHLRIPDVRETVGMADAVVQK